MMKFDVVRPKKYEVNGEEKTAWLNVGQITKFDNEGMILELNQADTVYQIFPKKTKEEREAQFKTQPAPQQQRQEPEIDVDNLF